MYSVYQTNHLAGIGVAVVIVSYGKQSNARFAEYHVLLPHEHASGRPSYMSLRYSVEMPEQALSQEELRNYVRDDAKSQLQNHVDEQWLKESKSVPPLVIVSEADDFALRRLRFAGVCDRQLSTIATQTYCGELKSAIRNLSRLPVISSAPLG